MRAKELARAAPNPNPNPTPTPNPDPDPDPNPNPNQATAQLGTRAVPIGLQPCPSRLSGAGTPPSHSYFNADWGQRIRALACAV